jgi:hypothetical protein
MRRFLMLVGVAVVAAAMYVAASPASQQSSGPTAKQFAVLKKQVAVLSKKVATAQNDVNAVAVVYAHCSLHSEIGITQRGELTAGSPTWGYTFTDNGGPSSFATALDLTALPVVAPASFAITPYNAADPACQSLVGKALRHNTASLFAQKFAQRP